MTSSDLSLPPPRRSAQPEWTSPEGHTLFRPPPSLPTFTSGAQLYLDPDVIPSFPPDFAGIGSGRLNLAQTLSYGNGAPSGDSKAGKGHARTWSGSPASKQRDAAPPANYVLLDAQRLKLEPRRVQHLIRALRALVPAERLPSNCHETPECLPDSLLLIPGGMLLEAILLERESTDGTESKPRNIPPALDSGVTLFPSYECGIDWRIMAGYTETFGKILDAFLPLLKRSGQLGSVGAEVLSGLKKQVSKMKKLLGDVVALYVEHHGWLNGMWDESQLVKTVEEVARWSKLVI